MLANLAPGPHQQNPAGPALHDFVFIDNLRWHTQADSDMLTA